MRAHDVECCFDSRQFASGGVYERHCSTALRKHELPRLCSDAPMGYMVCQCSSSCVCAWFSLRN